MFPPSINSVGSGQKQHHVPFADEFSVPVEDAEILRICKKELRWLIRLCGIGIHCVGPYEDHFKIDQLLNLQIRCSVKLIRASSSYCSSLDVLQQVIDLRKLVKKACSDAVSGLVIFSISSAVKGGIYINIGSHSIWAPDNLSVHNPLLQMVLFADRQFPDGSFGCLESMAPKSIAHIMETSGSSASPTEYIANWISAKLKLQSANAVRNPPCGSKKPLLPVLFNISAIKKTSSTVSVIPESGDNVKPGPYDSSMNAAEGNCGVSNKRNMELVKAGSRLSFREDSNNCHQQQGAITETTFTPVVPKLIEVDPHHLRKIGFASEDDTFIHMMEASHGSSADRSMQYITILDSGASYHCTGDRSLLSDYLDGLAPVPYLRGAGGTLMKVYGTGSIHNENFQAKGVLYVPGLNNQPNINKTIFSVSKLNELGFSVLFNRDGTSSVMNLEHEIVGKAQNVRGVFLMDYLRVLENRAPVAMLEGRGPGLLKSLWNASLSVWTSITGRLSQRTTSTQRLPV